MAIVYLHKRLDNNEVFYVGIGKTLHRSKSKERRNPYWHNIVNKYNYNIEIYKENITWEEACNIEIELIKKYGRKNNNTGKLVNMTDGGEGSLGRKQKESTKLKISLANKGNKTRKGQKNSTSTREKISKSKLGKEIKSRKKVIDTSTGIIYNSPLELCKIINMKYSTLASYLNGYRKNKTTFIYYK